MRQDEVVALRRLWPAIEHAMKDMVFTADKAGEVAADMNIVRVALMMTQTPRDILELTPRNMHLVPGMPTVEECSRKLRDLHRDKHARTYGLQMLRDAATLLDATADR